MNPKIISLNNKTVVGMKSSMYHGEYHKIVALWKTFMPRKKEIQNELNKELLAMQIYSDFNGIKKPFDIWACVEVLDFENIPKGMENFVIPEGLYAVFIHKGMDASETYQKIITEWLPTSGYSIDDRPHFQVMGKKYINGSPDSEEDFYVPIRLAL